MPSLWNPHQSAYPVMPPSLTAGDHEMRDYYAASQDQPRPPPSTAPSITPYLGLRARLSQVWLNRWTVLLILVLVRTLIAISGLNHDLNSARREALSACSSVESMGSAMASMPHYMSQGVNELTASGIEKAVNGLESMLFLTVTGVEEIVLFVINLMTSTYTCLITFAIRSSVGEVVSVLEDASGALNDTIHAITHDLGTTADAFEKVLNSVTKKIDDIPGINIPKLDLSSDINKLNTLELPVSLDADLQKLNNSLPTFAQVQNFTNNAISFPFEEVKKIMRENLGNYTFDRSVLPVPAKEQLTFCSDNNGINNFFDDLQDIANIARKVFIGVLVVAAVLACIPMGYREIRRWRTMQNRAQLVEKKNFDSLDVVYLVNRPYTSTAGVKASNMVKSTRRQILVRWVVAYATSAPALFVLSLGAAGLFACLCQYLMLKAIQKETPKLANEVGDFAAKVVNSLNNASESWAIATNGVIGSTNHDINKDVFGWVNTTTGAINDTLNVFANTMTTALNDTFGGTPLYGPVTEIFECLVGLKIAGIQKGLDWVSDNAQINLPTLNNNTFSLGAAESIAGNSTPGDSFLSDPSDTATDDITAAVLRVTDSIASAIRTEAIISSVVVLMWFVVVLSGMIRAATLWFGHDKVRGEGGGVGFVHEPQDAFVAPRTDSPAPAYEVPSKEGEKFQTFDDLNVTRASLVSDTGEYDHKYGHAGQRNDASISGSTGHHRQSSYGEVRDEKR